MAPGGREGACGTWAGADALAAAAPTSKIFVPVPSGSRASTRINRNLERGVPNPA